MNTTLRQYYDLLVAYLKPERASIMLLGVLIFGGIGTQLVAPQLIGSFIDLVQNGSPASELVRIGLLFVAAALARQILTVLSRYVGAGVGWRTTNALRVDLLRHCLDLDMSFHAAHGPGETVERIDSDVSQLANLFSQFVIPSSEQSFSGSCSMASSPTRRILGRAPSSCCLDPWLWHGLALERSYRWETSLSL